MGVVCAGEETRPHSCMLQNMQSFVALILDQRIFFPAMMWDWLLVLSPAEVTDQSEIQCSMKIVNCACSLMSNFQVLPGNSFINQKQHVMLFVVKLTALSTFFCWLRLVTLYFSCNVRGDVQTSDRKACNVVRYEVPQRWLSSPSCQGEVIIQLIILIIA